MYHVGEIGVCGQPFLHSDVSCVLIDVKQTCNCAVPNDGVGELVERLLFTTITEHATLRGIAKLTNSKTPQQTG